MSMNPFSFQLDEFYFDLEQNGNRIINLTRDQIQQKPFPGLRPFKTSEYQIFKGRDGQAEELINRLDKNFFLAVVGSSGTGKSSLVRAGLIPQLLGGYLYSAGTQWKIAICRPGKDPIENLAVALASTKCGCTQQQALQKDFEEVNAALRRSIYGLLEVSESLMTNTTKEEKSQTNLLVIVDQFEELFRFKRNDLDFPNIEDHFVNLLLKAALNIHSSIYVVITMRSEFLGDSIKYRGLPEAINQGQYLVPQLDRMQLKQVIEEPIQLASKTISEGLVELLVNEIEEGKIKENTDQLPILQHALMRTYQDSLIDNKEGAEICYENYQSAGGMLHALANHAELKFKELGTPKKQSIAKVVFQSITDLSTDQKGGRKPIELQNIYEIAKAIGATTTEVDEVINQFRDPDTSFIMPPINTTLSPHLIIDISHESLMRNWKRLNEWIVEDARNGRLYKILDDRRVLKELNKDEWLRGGLLEEITSWKEQYLSNYAWAKKTNQSTEQAYNSNIKFLKDSKSNKNNRKWLVRGSIMIGIISLMVGVISSLNSRAKMKALPSARKDILSLTNERFFRSGLFTGSTKDSVFRDRLVDFLIETKFVSGQPERAQEELLKLNELSKDWETAGFNQNAALFRAQSSYNPNTDKMLEPLFLKTLNRQWFIVYSDLLDPNFKWIVASKNKRFLATPGNERIKLYEIENETVTRIYDVGFENSSKIRALTVKDNGTIIGLKDDIVFEIDEAGRSRNSRNLSELANHQWHIFSPDGQCVVSSYNGKTIITFLKQQKISSAPIQSHGSLTGVAFSNDSKNILITEFEYNSNVYKVHYFDISKPELLSSRKGKLLKGVTSANFTDDGQFIIVRQNDNIKILDKGLREKFYPFLLTSKSGIEKIELSKDWKHLLIQYRDDYKSVVYENSLDEVPDSIFSSTKDKQVPILTKREIPTTTFFEQPILLHYPLLAGIMGDKIQVLSNEKQFKTMGEAFQLLDKVAPLSVADKIEYNMIKPDTLSRVNDLIEAGDYYYYKYENYDSAQVVIALSKARNLYYKAITNKQPWETEIYLLRIIRNAIFYQFSIDKSYKNISENLRELIAFQKKAFTAAELDSHDEDKKQFSIDKANLAWFILFLDKHDESIEIANEALAMYPSNTFINSTLALGYLLKNDLSKTLEIYSTNRGKHFTVDEGDKDAFDVFSKDLNDLQYYLQGNKVDDDNFNQAREYLNPFLKKKK